jgi:DNA-directed RNA polymerase specialized sigma subunit
MNQKISPKEFLLQAARLDQRINSKLGQLSSLNELATKCTSTITGMPHNPSPSTSQLADAVAKIIDLKNEINADIDHLVDIKCEMVKVIKAVDDIDCRLLLEFRYLCYKTWEQIAVEMDFQVRHVYEIHKIALQKVEKVLSAQ